MAPKTIDYSNTIIYKIQHEDNDDKLVYVGSTTDFIRRKYFHKYCCNNPNSKAYNRKVYQMIRDNGGWECFKMLEIKKYPCNDSREAASEEERFRQLLNPSMNSYKAYSELTQQEQIKEWKQNHPEKNRQYIRKWRGNNPDYDKNYHINNRDKIRERKAQKITCDCGAIVSINGLAKHRDTGKHFRYIQNKNIE